MVIRTPTAVATSLAERLNLRFPVLVIALGVVTLLDIVIPDLIPFVDELGLILLTLVLSRWKARRQPPEPVRAPGPPPSVPPSLPR